MNANLSYRWQYCSHIVSWTACTYSRCIWESMYGGFLIQGSSDYDSIVECGDHCAYTYEQLTLWFSDFPSIGTYSNSIYCIFQRGVNFCTTAGGLTWNSPISSTITITKCDSLIEGNFNFKSINEAYDTIICTNGSFRVKNPFTINITNEILNNPTFPSPEVLLGNYSNTIVPPIKICADGSAATKIFITNIQSDDGNYYFNHYIQIASDPYSTNEGLSGWLECGPTSFNDTIVIKFNHPTYVPSNFTNYRKDTILIFYGSTTAICKIPIEVYRAPVVMVHGIWADRSTFEKMEDDLITKKYYPSLLLWRADYKSTNSYHFNTNRNIVPENIDIMLSICRAFKFSAGKVDLVCHSMGGILARLYLQDNSYKNDIHKLITLNTPHAGAQSANLLTNPSSYSLRILFDFLDKPTYKGAVDDLKVNSYAISNQLNGSTINHNTVPSHTIITQSDFFPYLSWGATLISTATYLFGYKNPYLFMHDLYIGESCDLVVPISSQEGGLYANTYISGSQWHSSTENPAVIDTVENLLNADPNSYLFYDYGFDPPQLISIYKMSLWQVSSQQGSGTVTITSPSANSTFNSGSVIPVSVTATGTINRILYAASNMNTDINWQDLFSTNVTFSDSVPANALGVRKIIAMGFDTDGFVAMDTININITTSATLDSISLYGNAIYVQKNKTAPVSVIAYYNNGHKYNISNFSNIQYQVADTNYAKYIGSNLIQGKDTGMTMLAVTYISKTKNIPVVVIPEDTTSVVIFSINENQNPYNNLLAQKIRNINIYPNPFNNTTTIQYQLMDNKNVSVKVFDIYGQLVSELLNSRQNFGQHKIFFDGNKLMDNVYIIEIRTDNQSVTRKLLLIK